MLRIILPLAMLCMLSCSSEIPSTKSVSTESYESQKLIINPAKPGHQRPLIAIIGPNSGTETTDYIIPLSILRRSGVADVIALSTDEGPIQMMPALKIRADRTISEFDKDHPEGADLVIVPAVHDSENEVLIQWIKDQAAKKAQIVSICEGARVVANAGLFQGREATTHWYAIDDLKKNFSDTNWRQDVRYIQSGQVISTSGVTASIPVSLALVEAIGGKRLADDLAKQLDVKEYGNAHDGTRFQLNWTYKWLVVGNTVSFWNHETIGLPIEAGVDELGLALTADAWSRTYKSNVVTMNSTESVSTLNKLVIIPDQTPDGKVDLLFSEYDGQNGEKALEFTLGRIRERYGLPTSAFVGLQLEYPMEN